jgi:3-oxo-4,17-pregnadiene-20-carboxyl-CoA hydratase beta subunit
LTPDSPAHRRVGPVTASAMRRRAGYAGATLPELVIDVTPTFVISTAIATRDFQDVHHDRDRAVERGSKDIFLNILTTTGLVQRYVTDWAGPQALVRKIAIRLGAPCYAGDTLTFSGRVSDDAEQPGRTDAEQPGRTDAEQPGRADAPYRELVIEVTGRCGLGDHVTGTVRVSVPAASPSSGAASGAEDGA